MMGDNGVSRFVITVGCIVLKFPNFLSWRRFLLGLLANITELTWSRTADPRLCPILFSLPGGFLNVMPWCTPLEYEGRVDRYYVDHYDELPVENKSDSFGYYRNRLVAVDYGDIDRKVQQ